MSRSVIHGRMSPPRLFVLLAVLALLLAACAGDEPAATDDDVADDEPIDDADADDPEPDEPAEEPAGDDEAYEPEPLDPPVDFTFGLLPSQNPVFVGIERGYFEEEGLNVEYEFLGSGAEVVPSLASGHIDAGTSSPAAGLFNALARDVPVQIVADAGYYREGYSIGAFVLRDDLVEDGTVEDLEDLEGLTLAATAEGVAMDMFNLLLIEEAGLEPEDVNFEYMGFPDMMAALGAGQIDGAQLTEPFITRGEQEGFLQRWIPHSDLERDGQQVILMFGPRLIEEDVEVGERFLAAWVRSARAYNAAFGPEAVDRDEVVAIMSEHLGQEEEVLDAAVPTYFHPNGELNRESIEFRQQFWVDRGAVDDPIDIEDVIDDRFVEYAVSVLGSAATDD